MRAPATPRSWIRALPLLVLAGLVVAGSIVLLAASAEASPGSPERTVISTETSDPEVAFEAFNGNPPKLYDVDGDGDQEIINQNDNDWVYVFDPETGEILFETTTSFPSGWGARSFNGPEVSVLEHEGRTHLVVANSAAVVTMLEFDAEASNATHFEFTQEWDRRLDGCHDDPGMDAKPTLAELDGDGQLEILVGTEETGVYAVEPDGSLLWTRCIGGGNGAPRVADLDQDGSLDVVHGSDAGFVSALEGATGDWMWGYALDQHYDLGTPSITVAPGIGQLDGEGGPEVLVGARDSHDPGNWSDNHAMLVALTSGGDELFAFQDEEAGNPLTYTRPIVVDADEDGSNEVYWGDWNTVGHKPPPPDSDDAWMTTGAANFYRFNATGAVEWSQQLGTYWSNKDLAVADVTGDGEQEVLANGPDRYDGIWYLDADTGEKLQHVSTHPWKVTRGPVVGDLYGNGTTQFVVPAEAATSEVDGGAMIVYDTGTAYDAAWPHLPDPRIPAPPPEPNGTFNATFRIDSPNEWWQEVYVEPDVPRAITAVELRIEGGAWLDMEERDWRAWTASRHTPEGTQVEFRAHDEETAASVSKPFTWLDGTTERSSREAGGNDTDGNDTQPDPAFEVRFDPVDGNEWWVETYVDAPELVASVQARDDGGPWVELDHRDWGAWAESFHVADGSAVEFRATNTEGDTNVSQPYRWPNATPTNRSTSANFTAAFDPVGGNEWWVETYVDANRDLEGVQARDDGGPWVELENRDWGAWAASFYVEDGSIVEFRANSTEGEMALSGEYRWPEGTQAS